jgi:hypothetical protein
MGVCYRVGRLLIQDTNGHVNASHLATSGHKTILHPWPDGVFGQEAELLKPYSRLPSSKTSEVLCNPRGRRCVR